MSVFGGRIPRGQELVTKVNLTQHYRDAPASSPVTGTSGTNLEINARFSLTLTKKEVVLETYADSVAETDTGLLR